MYNNLGVTFDGSLEGFFSIIHAHFYDKINPLCIEDVSCYQPLFGVQYINIETDFDKSKKVMAAIAEKFSPASVHNIYYAYLNFDETRFFHIYNYILLGFKLYKNLDNYLQEDCVIKVNLLSQNTSKEATRMWEFCRFAETKSGVFYSEMAPKNNVLPLVAEFFTDRFKNMNWVIHDVSRETAAFYNTKECIFRELKKDAKIIYSADEEKYQKLWQQFFKSIGIKERRNPKIQDLFLPKRYRKYMTEFR